MCRNLRCQGIGAEVRYVPIITPAEEEKLWLTAVLNINNQRSLQRRVFYYIGKCFCICGGQEQRNPRTFKLQMEFQTWIDPHCVTYIEHGLKNRSGGLSEEWRTRKLPVTLSQKISQSA